MSEVRKQHDLGANLNGGAFSGAEARPDRPVVPQSINTAGGEGAVPPPRSPRVFAAEREGGDVHARVEVGREAAQPTGRERIIAAGLEHLPTIFHSDVTERGFSRSYLNSLGGTRYVLETDEIYDRERVRQGLRETPTYAAFWDRRISDVNEVRERRMVGDLAYEDASVVVDLSKVQPRIDGDATRQVFVTDQPGVAEIDAVAAEIRALADRDDLSREALRTELATLHQRMEELIGPPPPQPEPVERVRTRSRRPAPTRMEPDTEASRVDDSVLNEVVPRVSATDSVSAVVPKERVAEALGVTGKDLDDHLTGYGARLRESGLRLRGVTFGKGEESSRYLWVEPLPEATITVLGDVVRFGDKQMPISTADAFVLSTVQRRARPKDIVDTMATNLRDSEGVPGDERVATLNERLRALTERDTDVIATGGDETVGIFYHPNGVDIDFKPNFSKVSTEHIAAFDAYLAGGDIEAVKAALGTGRVRGMEEGGLTNAAVFENLYADVIKIINRRNANILQPDEVTLYERMARTLESSGYTVVTFLQLMANRFGVSVSAVDPEKVAKQTEALP